jgi:hypothetical protein
VLVTLRRVSADQRQVPQLSGQLSKLARTTFGLLAKSAGGEKLANRIKVV